MVARLERTDITAALSAATADDGHGWHLAQALRDRDDVDRRRREAAEAFPSGAIDITTLTLIDSQLTDLAADAAERVRTLSEAGDTNPLAMLADAGDIGTWWHEVALLEQKRRLIRAFLTVRVAPGRHGAKSFDLHRLLPSWHDTLRLA
ncbi:MAG: hypothetical protein QM809_18265 [Gordonia sp. (in: high G+C Gram-positive bacteria)]|uniref:hypothetical protein n=1 Tax=Gordonia sp. (in: high G+C Gram-positive bacteria) TaxID=84139 RepID=UPI0039E43E38